VDLKKQPPTNLKIYLNFSIWQTQGFWTQPTLTYTLVQDPINFWDD
jgi:hypothetical protein